MRHTDVILIDAYHADAEGRTKEVAGSGEQETN